jgi:Zn-finger nucleic acid-binding protein
LRCPDCCSEMSAHRISGVSLLQCDECPAVWVGAAERKALSQGPEGQRKQESAEFIPGPNPPSVRCPSCQGGRLQAGRIGQREVMYCVSCRGILVSFRRPPWADKELATWRKVLGGVLEELVRLTY